MRRYLHNQRGGGQGSGRLWGTVIGAVVGIVVAVASAGTLSAVTPQLIGLGASIGGTVGGLAGALYDTATAPDQVFEQEQLSRIFIQDSGYGQAIPQVFQRYRLAGNVIWLGDKLRHEHREVVEPPGGKGGSGPETVNITYTYTVSLAILLCDTRLSGPMKGISKIWADGTVIYDNQVASGLPEAWTLYPGTAVQDQDPTIVQELGLDDTPAYRSRCYVVGKDVNLGATGRVPNYTFEVYQTETTTPLIGLARDPVDGSLRSLDLVPRVRGHDPETLAPGPPNVVLGPEHPLIWGAGVAMATTPSHLTWITTSDGYRVWRLTASGGLTTWEVGYTLAGNLVFLGETMYTAGFHYDQAEGYFVRADGAPPSTHALPLGDYYRLAAFGSGVACLSNVGTVVLFTPGGAETTRLEFGGQIWDVLYHPSRSELWVTDTPANSLRVYSLAGALLATYPTAGYPMHLTVDDQGQVWCAGTLELVRHEAATGAITVQEVLSTPTQANPGYTVLVPATDGAVWATNWQENRLARVHPDGRDELLRLPANPVHLIPDPTDGGVYVLCDAYQQIVKVFPDLTVRMLPSTANLPALLTTLCMAAGLPADALDTSLVPNEPIILGLMNVEAARIPVEMLCRAYQLLPIESNGVLKFLPRSAALQAATIPATDLLATDASGPTGATVVRLPESQMPTAIQVLYIDPEQSYQQNTQRATLVPALDETARPNERTLNVLIGLTPQQAKRVAQESMDRFHLERTSVQFATTRQYAHVEPGDVVMVEIRGLTYPVLLTEVAYGRPGMLRCTGTVNSSAVLDQWVPLPGDPPSHEQPPVFIAPATPLFLHLHTFS